MCLLSFYPTGVEVDAEALRTGAESNPDGFGFALIDAKRNKIIVSKSMKPGQLIDNFVRLRAKHIDAPALFHCRLTTDGLTGKSNNHPFYLHDEFMITDKKTVLAHNGIFPTPARPSKGDIRSDTRIVAEELAYEWDLRTHDGRLSFGEWMGTGNKVALLTVDPSYQGRGFLINGHLGQWEEGAWYSNGSYKWPRYTSYTKSDWKYVGGAWYETQGRDDYRPAFTYHNCLWCKSKGTVHNLTLICAECKRCEECSELATNCPCPPYWQSEGYDVGTEYYSGRESISQRLARESISVESALAEIDRQADELDDMIDDEERTGAVVYDGAVIWPKVLGPGPVPTGWPDSMDPRNDVPSDDDPDEDLTGKLSVLVAHLNNGGEL